MKSRLATSFALAVGLLAAGSSVFAHHGNTAYDTSKAIVIKNAVVTKFVWANPHSFVMADIKDDKGEVTHWSAEGPDPAVLVAVGWGKKKTMNALAPGTEITITIQPARNGKPVAEMNNIVLPNGDLVCSLGGARTGNCAVGESK